MRKSRSLALRLAGALVGLVGCYEWHGDPPPSPPPPSATDAGSDAGVSTSACAAQDVTRTEAWSTCMSDAPFYWNGTACMWIGDCACMGPSCGAGYPTFDACMEAHAACVGTQACTSADDCGGTAREAGLYCHVDGALVCGAPGRCWPRPAQPLDCGFALDGVCGCSHGDFFGNRCRSHLLGQDGAPGCAR